MRSYALIGYLIALAVPVFCTPAGSQAVASPVSQGLQAALDTSQPLLAVQKASLETAISRVCWQAQRSLQKTRLRVSQEGEWGAPRPRADGLTVPGGTLRQQFDVLAQAGGYKWITSGDWVSFIPAGKADDPDWILNKRYPGKLVISTDAEKDATFKQWLRDLGVEGVRVMGEFLDDPGRGTPSGRKDRFYGPDTIVLDHPTLREAHNAHEAQQGIVGSLLTVRVLPPQKAGDKPIYLIYASYSLL